MDQDEGGRVMKHCDHCSYSLVRLYSGEWVCPKCHLREATR